VSCGGHYDSGFLFSQGDLHKLNVLDAKTLETNEFRHIVSFVFCCRVYKDLLWIGCFGGHLFVYDLDTYEKKHYIKLQQGIYDIMVFEDDRAGIKEDFLIFG